MLWTPCASALRSVTEARELDAVAWATDTGVLTDEALEQLRGCRILGIEANHDPDMLANGPYPYYLKKRVGGSHGHLSNVQAAKALPKLVTERTETVVAMHISQKNNRPSCAQLAQARRRRANAESDGQPDEPPHLVASGSAAPHHRQTQGGAPKCRPVAATFCA